MEDQARQSQWVLVLLKEERSRGIFGLNRDATLAADFADDSAKGIVISAAWILEKRAEEERRCRGRVQMGRYEGGEELR